MIIQRINDLPNPLHCSSVPSAQSGMPVGEDSKRGLCVIFAIITPKTKYTAQLSGLQSSYIYYMKFNED